MAHKDTLLDKILKCNVRTIIKGLSVTPKSRYEEPLKSKNFEAALIKTQSVRRRAYI
jgi:hypothetical protein